MTPRENSSPGWSCGPRCIERFFHQLDRPLAASAQVRGDRFDVADAAVIIQVTYDTVSHRADGGHIEDLRLRQEAPLENQLLFAEPRIDEKGLGQFRAQQRVEGALHRFESVK